MRSGAMQASGASQKASAEGSRLQWVDLVGELLPRAVQVYPINRQPAARGVRPVSTARLEEIACLLRAQTGIDADVAVRAEQAPRCLDAE